MARTKTFEQEAVLERAMHVFWRQGFESTSIQDLVDATGINRASMYATFGDKEHLFLAAIDLYLARVNAKRLAILAERGSAPEILQRYFDDLIQFSTGEGRRLGCLLTNTAVELAPRNDRVGAKLREVMGRVEEAFYKLLRGGQAQGEVTREQDARAMARFLVGTVQGLRVLARANPDEAVLRDVVRVTLKAIAPASVPPLH